MQVRGIGHFSWSEGFLAQEGEYVEVDEDGAEHGAEDPEVVEPETLDLEGVVDPALISVSLMAEKRGRGRTQALART